jgi:hypothetical protein
LNSLPQSMNETYSPIKLSERINNTIVSAIERITHLER